VSTVDVLLAVPFGEAFTARLAAADDRLRVRAAPAELRRWLRGEVPEGDTARALVEQQAAEYLDSAEVLVGWARLPAEALARARKLRWIQSVGAGVDRMDPAAYRHLLLTNASGVGAIPIAEYIVGAMLLFAKGFPRMFRRQREHIWDRRFQARELAGRTCGIIGMGAIGGEAARRARALEMRVLAIRRSAGAGATSEVADELLPPSALPYLLRESDYVVLTVPLTSETRGMIGADELRQMKHDAVLINIARGPVVDEQALIAALRDGVIGGAALDVFEQEPLPADSPLWDMDNVVVTPHFAGGSDRYDDRLADMICDNLRRYLAGEQLRNVVDLDRGY
jgi:D-2-hydroxyacid dehydrogenase (NADP+)